MSKRASMDDWKGRMYIGKKEGRKEGWMDIERGKKDRWVSYIDT